MEHNPSRSYDTSAFSTEAVDAAPRRVVVDPANRFRLDPAFLAEFEGKQPAWGPIGYVVYKRTYARRVGSGDAQRSEEFWETLRRVTEGTFSLLKQQIRGAHRPWDDAEAQRKAQDFYRRMWAFKWLPPGRGLWIMGTEYLERHGGGAANNCGFVSTARVADDFSAPFCALMDWSMLGVGMGFDTRGAGKVRVVRPAVGGTYVVQDTREGWIDLMRTTLSAYVGAGALPSAVDVSGVRRGGEPICGFGGTASGPEPLLELWTGAQRILGAIEGQALTSAAITDLMNLIGRCVVAGNVRRSSEIALGDIGDADFLALKDPTRDREIAAEQRRIELAHGIDIAAAEAAQRQHSPLSPEFAAAQRGIDDLKARRYQIPEWAALDAERWALPLNAWRWASNNTVWADSATGDDLRRVGERIAHNGEPGIGWLDLMRSHGRLSDPATNDDSFADGMNPCQPDFATVLTPDGVRTFAEIDAGSIIWSGKRWTKVVKKWMTGVKPVFAHQTTAGVFVGTSNHNVISDGERVRAEDAITIDAVQGPDWGGIIPTLDPQSVMDGWVLGDGSVHKASDDLVHLYIGAKDGDIHTALSSLVLKHRPGLKETAWEVKTTITADELPVTYERRIPSRFRFAHPTVMCAFLRGLYSANGSVVRDRVTLKAASFAVIQAVQEMLSALGIPSYFTSNKGKEVAFSNGTYQCRDSYDLNITRGRNAFAKLIGFVQQYKTEKLRASCASIGPSLRNKTSFTVNSRTHLGDFPVYDITVEDEEHTYWTGGLLVSNCGEQTLWDAELCCLVETFPTKHLDGGRFDLDDYKATLKMAYLYAKVVSGIPTHRPDTNAVMAANRRIGTSQAGIVELYETLGLSECRRIWDESYRYVTALDAEYSRWMACPRSIKRTSVKPGGSIPLLPGVEGGMKWPSSRFYMRTVRIDRGNAMVPVLQRLGYRVEPNYTENRSVVAYFPVRSSARRFAAQVSLWEQAELAAALQAYWSDNMVSCTLTFRKEEAADVPRVIEAFAGRLKTVSFLPVEEHGYLQAPYIPCSEAEYEAAVAAITGDVSEALSAALGGAETKAEDERFCSGERCEWRPAT